MVRWGLVGSPWAGEHAGEAVIIEAAQPLHGSYASTVQGSRTPIFLLQFGAQQGARMTSSSFSVEYAEIGKFYTPRRLPTCARTLNSRGDSGHEQQDRARVVNARA